MFSTPKKRSAVDFPRYEDRHQNPVAGQDLLMESPFFSWRHSGSFVQTKSIRNVTEISGEGSLLNHVSHLPKELCEAKDAASMSYNSGDDLSSISGDLDTVTGLAWTIFSSNIYVWNYKESLTPLFCTVLPLPETTVPEVSSTSSGTSAWLAQFVRDPEFSSANETMTSGNKIGLVALNKETMETCYWPNLGRADMAAAVESCQGNTAWELSSANGAVPAGRDTVTCMLALPPVDSCGAILLAGCKSGQLWRLDVPSAGADLSLTWRLVAQPSPAAAVQSILALPPSLVAPPSANADDDMDADLDTDADLAVVRGSRYLSTVRARQLAREQASLVQEKAREHQALAVAQSQPATWRFLLLTSASLQGWSLTPSSTVPVWTFSVLGDRTVQAELAGQKQAWLLGMTLSPPVPNSVPSPVPGDPVPVTLFLASLGRDRRATLGSFFTNYWTLGFHLPKAFAWAGPRPDGSPASPLPPLGTVPSPLSIRLARVGPARAFLVGARPEEEGNLLRLAFRGGRRSPGTFLVLAPDGTASVLAEASGDGAPGDLFSDGEEGVVFQVDPFLGPGRVLAASFEDPSGDWALLTEKTGVWKLPGNFPHVGGGVGSLGTAGDHASNVVELCFGKFLEGTEEGTLDRIGRAGGWQKKNFAEASRGIVDSVETRLGTIGDLFGDQYGDPVGDSLRKKRKRHEKFLEFLEASGIKRRVASTDPGLLTPVLNHAEQLETMLALSACHLASSHSASSPSPSLLIQAMEHSGTVIRHASQCLPFLSPLNVFFSSVSQSLPALFSSIQSLLHKQLISHGTPGTPQGTLGSPGTPWGTIPGTNQGPSFGDRESDKVGICQLAESLLGALETAKKYRERQLASWGGFGPLGDWMLGKEVRGGLGTLCRTLCKFGESDGAALALAERCGAFLLDGFLEEVTRATDESLLAVYRPIRDELLGSLVDLRLKQTQNKLQSATWRTFEHLLPMAERHLAYAALFRMCESLGDTEKLQELMVRLGSPSFEAPFSQYVFARWQQQGRLDLFLSIACQQPIRSHLHKFENSHTEIGLRFLLCLTASPPHSFPIRQLALSSATPATNSLLHRLANRGLPRGTRPVAAEDCLDLRRRKQLLSLARLAELSGCNSPATLREIDSELKSIQIQEVLAAEGLAPLTGLVSKTELMELCLSVGGADMAAHFFSLFASLPPCDQEDSRKLLEEGLLAAVRCDDWAPCQVPNWVPGEGGTALAVAARCLYGGSLSAMAMFPVWEKDAREDGWSVESVLRRDVAFEEFGRVWLTAMEFFGRG